MSDPTPSPAPRGTITTRVVRPGEAEPPDQDWRRLTPAARIEAVWELTKLAYAWTGKDLDALPLQRSVTRVQRHRR